MKHHPVKITGMGIVSSIGHGISQFKESLQMGRSHFTREENLIISRLDNFHLKEALQKCEFFKESEITNILKITRKAGLPVQASIIALAEAWKEANLVKHKVNPEKISLITAGNNTTTQFLYENHETYRKEPLYLSPTYAMQFMDTYQLGVLSELFNIQGEGFTVGAASASGNLALIEGTRLIKNGDTDICIVMGTLADLSPAEIQGFINLGAMGGKTLTENPEKACCPFDAAHEGFIYGQSAACIILESRESANKRGVKSLAQIKGFANKLQGSHLTDPSEEAEFNVMKRAVEMGDCELSDVEYINTHGTSSPIGDITEIAAIKSLFKADVKNIWLNSTKSISGHCLWSAGVVEAISTVIQIQNSFVHPNLNLENPIDTECRFVGTEAAHANIRLALSNSFAFSGIHSSILIGKAGG
jgi:malonyl-ACP decarboxylase